MIIVATEDRPSGALTWNVSSYLSPFISLQPPGLNFDLDALNLSGLPGASGEQCLIMWNTTRSSLIPSHGECLKSAGNIWELRQERCLWEWAALCHPTQDGASTNWCFPPVFLGIRTVLRAISMSPSDYGFCCWQRHRYLPTKWRKASLLGSMHLLPSPKIMLHLPTLMFTFIPRVFVPCLHSLLWGLRSRDRVLGLYFCSFLDRSFANEWGVTLPRLEL